MEFKGSKGEWKRVKLETTKFYLERNEIHYGEDGECVAEFVHDDYDAQLISKAPEMLEALQTTLEELYTLGLLDGHREYLQELILSATTIK